MNTDAGFKEMPLSDIRVLDLGRHLAGPTCAMLLGDLGADVIKIEKPGVGEDGRAAGPPFFEGVSAFFLSANRNKRSLTLDIKRPRGRRSSAAWPRPPTSSSRTSGPGVMDALGIGYEAVSARNPRIIYCSISGFGADGPLRRSARARPDHPGHLRADERHRLRRRGAGARRHPDRRPADRALRRVRRPGRLQARERTGRGQRVDTSLLEAWSARWAFRRSATSTAATCRHRPATTTRSTRPTASSGRAMATSRSARPATSAGRSSAGSWRPRSGSTIPRFTTNGGRYEHRLELAELIEEKLQARGVDEWESLFNEAGHSGGPVYAMDGRSTTPRCGIARWWSSSRIRCWGRSRCSGLPVKLSETPGDVHRIPPDLGEHTDDILGEIGLDARARDHLREQGIV